MNDKAQKISDTCKAKFEANKGDCNKFAIAVASQFSIHIAGLADDIVDQIKGDGWTKLVDGVDAKNKADDGWFVIGGLKAADTAPTPPATTVLHGHVVIVTSGPLAKNKYPTALWGSDAGILPQPKKDTVNWAWNKLSVDKVIYSGRQI
jgi:hypothetical protein